MTSRRRSGRRRRGRTRRAAASSATALLALAVVVSPQLLGGAYGWGVAIIVSLAALSAAAAAWAARSDPMQAPIGPVGVMVWIVVIWTALQIVPLPRAVTELLQPQALEMADQAAQLLDDDPPGWVAVSMAPGNTRAALVSHAGAAAAFFAAMILVALGHRRRVFQMIGASTIAMAVVAASHLAAGADRVFGLYEPVYTASPLLAPLVNQNHLSGFLSMGVPLLLGLGLDAEDRRVRAGWLAAAAGTGACTLLAVSRGGAASLLVGLLCLGSFALLRRRRRERRGQTPLLLIGATAATAVGVWLYVGAGALYQNFERSDFSKLTLAAQGLDLALDHPFIGVGRGAFSAAFVSRHGGHVRFEHPENFLAQWGSEWGLVITASLIVVTSVAVLGALKGKRSFARFGAVAGLTAIVTHDLVDFAMEMPGVAVVVAALVGAIVAPSRRRAAPSPRRGPPQWLPVGAASAVAFLLVAAFGWSLDADRVRGLSGELQRQMRDGDAGAFQETLREAVRLHPAEPTFVLLGGAEAARRGDPRALMWLNRAMLLAPGWPAPHHEVAHWMAAHGHLGQSFVEAREAAERGQQSPGDLPCSILRRHPDAVEALIRSAGDDEIGLRLLDRVSRCLPRESPAAVTIDAALVGEDVLSARLRASRRALAGGDLDEAVAVLGDADESDARVLMARARILRARGDPDQAAAILEAVDVGDQHAERVLELRAGYLAEAGQAEPMRETCDQLRGRAAGSASRLAHVWIVQGNLERRLGNDGRAMQAYSRAHRLDHRSSGLLLAARLAERLGNLPTSYGAYAELCAVSEPGSAACAARDRVRGRMVESPRPSRQRFPAP